ncbi:MAG: serine/threonine-protein kinase [Kiritimatiellae bacterium]|nr:serine/threonine-protein kinase [Kiritimatiellia bacterium]
MDGVLLPHDPELPEASDFQEMLKLVFLTGPLAGRKYAFDRRITIGRDMSNDISIADPAVSLVHCEILFDEHGPLLRDLGSTNGVRVNDRLTVTAHLSHGDIISLGHSRIRVEVPFDSHKHLSPGVHTATGKDGASKTGATHLVPPDPPPTITSTMTYYLRRKIASGGMGAVYEADQLGAEGFVKKVAIKTILPTHADKETFVSSFVAEAKLAADLVHENIVQIHHLGRYGEGYFIAMEYIDGVNLHDFMNMHRLVGRQMPEPIAFFILLGVSRGLAYAHAKCGADGQPLHLVHRDVSPSNIMLTRDGQIKLTDFGVAKAATLAEESEDVLVGSVEYMSPEQAACALVDARSDIFSVGTVFYEMVTGTSLFGTPKADMETTVARVRLAEVPDPRRIRPGLSDAAVEIMMRCLKQKPEDRYPSAGHLADSIQRVLYSGGATCTHMTMAEYLSEMEKEVSRRGARKPLGR